jgi:hypothetical protein
LLFLAFATLTMAQESASSDSVSTEGQNPTVTDPSQASEGTAEEATGPQFGDLFGYAESSRDVGTGFGRLFKSVGTGVMAGAATLVSAPIAGAREGGAKGFAAGFGLGLVGAVVLPITGAVYGCAEVARGAANTPDAIKAQQADLEWDHDAKVRHRRETTRRSTYLGCYPPHTTAIIIA